MCAFKRQHYVGDSGVQPAAPPSLEWSGPRQRSQDPVAVNVGSKDVAADGQSVVSTVTFQ